MALETALGGAMQNIVVETEQDAKAAIRLLQQRDLGRATFLPPHHHPRRRAGPAGDGGPARLRGHRLPAVPVRGEVRRHPGLPSWAGVAVAEDLDSAVAIAKRMKYRFRIVSLDGQVVNAGGLPHRRLQGQKLRPAQPRRRDPAGAGEGRRPGAEGRPGSRPSIRSARRSWPPAPRSWTPPRGSSPPSRRERIKVQAEAARAARELENAAKELENLERERSDSQGRLSEMEALQAQSQEKIAALEQQLSQAQAQSQSLTGDREEQLARCEDIAQTIQEIRLHQFFRRKGPGRPGRRRPGAGGPQAGFRPGRGAFRPGGAPPWRPRPRSSRRASPGAGSR